MMKKIRPKNHEGFDNIYEREGFCFGITPSDGLIKFLKDEHIKPCKALDLGAGEGRNALYLAAHGFDVVAIDKSRLGIKKLITRAEKLGLRILGIDKDFLQFNFPPQEFELIVSINCLDHMELNERRNAEKKIVNILRKDGYIYIIVFTTEDPGFMKKTNISSECSNYVKYYFRKGDLKNLFDSLEIIEYREYTKPDRGHGRPHIHGKAKLIARKRKKER